MSFRMKLLRSYWKTLTSLFEFYAATPVTLPSMLFLNKSDLKHVTCCLPCLVGLSVVWVQSYIDYWMTGVEAWY